MRYWLFGLYMIWALSSAAQTNKNTKPPYTRKQFIADSIRIMKPVLIRPQFRLDNRITFLNNEKLNITGVDAGVMLKEKLRVTLGYYRVTDKLSTIHKTINDTEYKGQYALNYGALNTEFIYKNTRFFSLGMPLEFGFGSNSLNYRSTVDDTETERQNGFIAMTYFGLSGTFKPLRFIGLKLALGYRKTVINQIRDIHFDGVYSSVSLALDIREAIKDIQMYRIIRKYRKSAGAVETAVDLITD